MAAEIDALLCTNIEHRRIPNLTGVDAGNKLRYQLFSLP